jgi:hypothetical protein
MTIPRRAPCPASVAVQPGGRPRGGAPTAIHGRLGTMYNDAEGVRHAVACIGRTGALLRYAYAATGSAAARPLESAWLSWLRCSPVPFRHPNLR